MIPITATSELVDNPENDCPSYVIDLILMVNDALSMPTAFDPCDSLFTLPFSAN